MEIKKVENGKEFVLMSIEDFGKSKNFHMQKFRGFIHNLEYKPSYRSIIKGVEYYNQDLLENIGNRFLKSEILPNLEKRLRDSGVEFDYAVITHDLINLAIKGDVDNSKVAVFIYLPVKRIKKEYGLVGLKHLAAQLADKQGYDMTSVYKRLKAGVLSKKIKPVAYGMKLNPLYDRKKLINAYKYEMEKRNRVVKKPKVEE